ncbi:MAG: TIGR04211 family SH3 domain-containing protein [Gammaproteobacteria bacterium]|nr:TIGR04211 family SH3 domain-containing protein [Gammaproteobacteria bacterium]
MNIMYKYAISCSFIFSLLVLPIGDSLAGSTRYVTDELTIPMRTGTTNRHKIIKFIPSGTRLSILETSEDGSYIKTQIDDTEGWVEAKLLMDNPGAKEQLEKANRRLEAITQDNAPLKQKIDQANKLIDDLTGKNQELHQEKEQLLTTLTKLRNSAANPIKVAEENEQLKQEIETKTHKINALINENNTLKDQNIKEWFVIGAVVSLGSLIFGLIIPRISWRKRKSWGEF